MSLIFGLPLLPVAGITSILKGLESDMSQITLVVSFICILMLTGCGKNPMDHVQADAEKFDVTTLWDADDLERIVHSCRYDAERGRNDFEICVKDKARHGYGSPVIQSVYDYCRKNYSHSSKGAPDACYVYSSTLRDMVDSRYRQALVAAVMPAFEKLAAEGLAEKIAQIREMPVQQIKGILQALEARETLTPEESAQLTAGRETLIAKEAEEAARKAKERDEAEARFNPARWKFDTDAEKNFYTMPTEQAAFIKIVNEASVKYKTAKNPVKREVIFEEKEKALQKILPVRVICYGIYDAEVAKGTIIKRANDLSEVPDNVRKGNDRRKWCLKSDNNSGWQFSVTGVGELTNWVGTLIKITDGSYSNTAKPVIAIGPDIVLQYSGYPIDAEHILAEKIADLSEGDKVRFSGYIGEVNSSSSFENMRYVHQYATEKPEYKMILTEIDTFKAEDVKP